jgi:Spy/CpxP family protein refolding chaperone
MCTTMMEKGKRTVGLNSFLVLLITAFFSVQVGSAQTMVPGAQTMPGMMSQGEMWRMGDIGCPMMSELATSVSRILSYRYDIDLTPEQVDQLKNIRDKYQKDAVQLYADLHAAMLELSNDLEEEEVDMGTIRNVNDKIEKDQAALRSRNIEVFLNARSVLTKDQINELRTRGLWNISVYPWHQGMMQP